MGDIAGMPAYNMLPVVGYAFARPCLRSLLPYSAIYVNLAGKTDNV